MQASLLKGGGEMRIEDEATGGAIDSMSIAGRNSSLRCDGE